jgi:hypothetical protein
VSLLLDEDWLKICFNIDRHVIFVEDVSGSVEFVTGVEGLDDRISFNKIDLVF